MNIHHAKNVGRVLISGDIPPDPFALGGAACMQTKDNHDAFDNLAVGFEVFWSNNIR